MKTLLNIGDRNRKVETVLCEWGKQYCCLAGFDPEANQINWLTYKTYDWLNSQIIQAIIEEVGKADNFIVGSCFPEFLLTPSSYNSEEALEHLFPNTTNTITVTDSVNEWQLKNYYLIPDELHMALHDTYKNVSYFHFFTAALKVYNGSSAGDQIAVHFAPNQFSVVVKKNGQLQLVQMYNYQTPSDVLYYLLKVVEECNLSKEDTELVISGLIEEHSDLYKELYQYFLHINLTAFPFSMMESELHPSHFFTSIFNLAACASLVEN